MRPSVSTLLLRPVVAALGGAPAAEAALYAATDLTAELLADDDARVSPSQQCVAWATLARLTGDATIALRIADATPPGAFGIVEYVCRSAPTLGAALRGWTRYLNLLDDAVVVGLVESGGRHALRVVIESEAPAPGAHELCFALVVAQARELCLRPFRLHRVCFTHAAPAREPAAHAAWFGAEVRFGARHTELVLDSADLDIPLRTADPALLAILDRAAAEQARARVDEPLVTARVRQVLREGLREDHTDIDHAAAQLGMTARSLQRRLREEGGSFAALREETRRQLADRYLADGHSLTEIAFLLGFSEPSAFFRAFKRWTGRTPVEHRRALG